MCGICGIVRFTLDPVEPDRLENACEAMTHRGPDHRGTWSFTAAGQSIGLGAVRLAILDPTPAGHQPMHREDGRYHLVFNGEIYNYRALRRELRQDGERFVTDSDTEVVLAACARWGLDALTRFNGMWALAFFDQHTGAGFLARDRFGIKPLLYRANRASLRFASEMPALLKLGDMDRTIDPAALRQLLQFGYIAHPATIYNDVRRLAPGHVLTFNVSGPSEPERYYDLPTLGAGCKADDYADSCSRVRRRLFEAVVRRRVSDVPIGAFLSGGLDSSIVVAHLASATGQPVKTFAVGHADQAAYDETAFARIVAKHFGTEHHELRLTHADVLEAIPRVLDHLGEPVGDSSIIPTSLVSRFAAGHVTVALSGDGGDELFGGYWRYLGHSARAAYQRLPRLIRRRVLEPLLRMTGSSKSNSLSNRARQFRKLLRADSPDAFARHVAWSRILAPEAESLFGDPSQAAAGDRHMLQEAKRLTAGLGLPDELDRILAFDLQYSLPGDMLAKVDLASMMHSLEVRVPFLDHELVELAMSLPARWKVDRGQRKRILIDAYRGHLPDAVLDRGKMGFEVPIGEYLRGPLREMFHDIVSRTAVESFGLLDHEAVQRLYQEHQDRRCEHADVLFALLSLCWWRGTGRTT